MIVLQLEEVLSDTGVLAQPVLRGIILILRNLLCISGLLLDSEDVFAKLLLLMLQVLVALGGLIEIVSHLGELDSADQS
jgi:hypothetical protein